MAKKEKKVEEIVPEEMVEEVVVEPVEEPVVEEVAKAAPKTETITAKGGGVELTGLPGVDGKGRETITTAEGVTYHV